MAKILSTMSTISYHFVYLQGILVAIQYIEDILRTNVTIT